MNRARGREDQLLYMYEYNDNDPSTKLCGEERMSMSGESKHQLLYAHCTGRSYYNIRYNCSN